MSDAQSSLDGLTLADLQAGRKVLYQAKMTGTLSVRFADGSQVQYRTMAEIDAALRDLDGRITSMLPAAADATPVRAFRLRFGSGYC